jgi:hypothetical protein
VTFPPSAAASAKGYEAEDQSPSTAYAVPAYRPRRTVNALVPPPIDVRAERGHHPTVRSRYDRETGGEASLRTKPPGISGAASRSEDDELARDAAVDRDLAAAERARDLDRRDAVGGGVPHGRAERLEGRAERADRPLAHPGRAGQGDPAVGEGRDRREQAEGRARVAAVEHGPVAARERAAGPLDPDDAVADLDRRPEPPEPLDGEPGVVGEEGVVEDRRPVGQGRRDQGAVGERLARRGAEREVDGAGPVEHERGHGSSSPPYRPRSLTVQSRSSSATASSQPGPQSPST